MSAQKDHGFIGIAWAAALFTAATACFGLLAENFAATLNEDWLEHWDPFARAMLGFAVFSFFTLLFWKVDGIALLFRRRNAPSIGQRDDVKAWLALTIFSLMAATHGFLGINVAQAMRLQWSIQGWCAVASGALAFFVLTLFFWSVRNQLAGIFAVQHHRSEGVDIKDARSPNYIGTLSILSNNPKDPKDASACSAAAIAFDKELEKTQDWSKAIKTLTNQITEPAVLTFWNGQQPLRSLANLIANFDEDKPFRVIRFLCTVESETRFEAFSGLLQHILSMHPSDSVKGIKIQRAESLLTAGGAWDRNKSVMQKELHRLMSDPLCARGKICLEITGGSADLSIIGAVTTISQPIDFRYVFTNHPFNVHNFDLQVRDTPME